MSNKLKISSFIFEDSGIRLKYFKGGSGKPVLFLHGATINALTYKDNLELLIKDYLVIAPDLPGFGGSTTPREIWSLNDYAHFLNKFLDTLNIKNINIVGHSFGGGVALYLAALNNKFSKLILIDSIGLPIHYSRLRLYYLFFIKKSLAAIFIYKKWVISFRVAKDFFKNVFKNFSKLGLFTKILEGSLFGECHILDQIKIPTLIMWGTKTKIIPKEHAGIFDKQIVNSSVKYIKGNHDWCIFKPQVFFDNIKKFI